MGKAKGWAACQIRIEFAAEQYPSTAVRGGRRAKDGSAGDGVEDLLAHAREDNAQVRKLYADLKARGLDPWLDKVDLIPGQNWEIEIPKAIREAGIFLACLSSRSVGKVGYIQDEFRLALSAFGKRPPGSIFLIPVRLDDCEVPDLQDPDLGMRLRAIHWVDLWEEDGFDRLVKAIEPALEGLVNPQARGPAIPLACLECQMPASGWLLRPQRNGSRAFVTRSGKRGRKASGSTPQYQFPRHLRNNIWLVLGFMKILFPKPVRKSLRCAQSSTAIATVAAALFPWLIEKNADVKGKGEPLPTTVEEKSHQRLTPTFRFR